MINTFKLWLRDIVAVDLPFGIFWTTYVAIDSGWSTGILFALGFILIIDMVLLYITTKDFSKRTYALDIAPEKPLVFTQDQVYMPKGLPPKSSILMIGLMIFSFITSSNDTDFIQSILFVVFVFYVFVSWLIQYAFDRLAISQEGIALHTIFYKIMVSWDNVQRIERRGSRWFVVCGSSQLQSLPIFVSWLRFVEADKLINLSPFTTNFLEGGMAKTMASFSDNVKVVVTA